VFRIRDILVQIRILGIRTFDKRIWMRIRLWIMLVFPTFKMPKIFFCFFLFVGAFTSFFKDKMSQRKRSPKTVKITVFLHFFCLLMEGSGSETLQLPYITDPDPESQKTHESYRSGSRCGSGTLLNTLHTHYCALFFTRRSVRYIPD